MTVPSRKPYIAGNWKMNLDRSRSLDLIKTVKGRIGDGTNTATSRSLPSPMRPLIVLIRSSDRLRSRFIFQLPAM